MSRRPARRLSAGRRPALGAQSKHAGVIDFGSGSARVRGQVRDDQHLVRLGESTGADRAVEVGLAGREIDPRLEPLPVAAHEADEGHRDLAELAGQSDDVVEAPLGQGIEDRVARQGVEAGIVLDEGRKVLQDHRFLSRLTPANAGRRVVVAFCPTEPQEHHRGASSGKQNLSAAPVRPPPVSLTAYLVPMRRRGGVIG